MRSEKAWDRIAIASSYLTVGDHALLQTFKMSERVASRNRNQQVRCREALRKFCHLVLRISHKRDV